MTNETLTLVNFMSNVWVPLIEISCGRKPSMMQIGDAPQEWFKSYMYGDEAAVNKALGEMLSSVI